MAGGLIAAAVVLFAAYIVVTTVAATVLLHSPLPAFDEWDSLELFGRILRQGTAWPDMFEPHNEHRLFFPRLVFFSDYLFFGGRGLLNEAVIFAVQALHVGLFVWLIRRSGVGRAARWALSGVVAVLLFSLYQAENFDWAFQVQFVGVFACASLCCTVFALGLAADRGGRPSAGYMAAAILFALVDTFTMANGILAGLVLVIMACLARAGGRVILLTAVAAAGLILLFSIGFSFVDEHPSTLHLLRNVPNELAFAAGYLAKLTSLGHAAKVVFGMAGIAALLCAAAAVWKEREARPVPLALVGIALFAAGSAAMTALGRASQGLGGMDSGRYATGAATFWAAILVAGWTLPCGPLTRTLARAAVSAASLFFLLNCAAVQMVIVRDMERRAALLGLTEDAMMLDLLDVPALEEQEESVYMVRLEAPFLRSRALSIFAPGGDVGRIGRPLSEIEGPRAALPIPCAGTFALARARPDLGREGVSISGSTKLRSRLPRPTRVYVVNGAGTVVGLARTDFGDDWRGYARASVGADLTAYAMSDGGRICRIGSAVVAPAG